jgi:hypothetical protein
MIRESGILSGLEIGGGSLLFASPIHPFLQVCPFFKLIQSLIETVHECQAEI